jgi:chromosome segregation ATPase
MAREQAQAATVEAQMGALFASLNGQLRENHLDEASVTIQSIRNFLNTPAFQSLRSIQARKELYTQSVNAFEAMVDEARRNRAIMAGDVNPNEEELAELREKNAELERTLEAFSLQGSGANRRITELQNINKTLDANSKQKDDRISALQSELTRNTETARQQADTARQQAAAAQSQITTLTQTVADRESTIKERESTIAANESTITEQRGQLRTRDRAITAIKDIVSSREITDMTVGELVNNMESIRQTLNAN